MAMKITACCTILLLQHPDTMFTGIIEEIGYIEDLNLTQGSGRLAVRGKLVRQDCHLGDSIAVNGVCLTVTDISASTIRFDVSAETLERSTLGLLQRQAPVNLERAMAANGRFGGHFVSGHIDGIGTIAARTPDANSILFTITAPPQLIRYVVEKGSIAIDGISLTIANCDTTSFTLSIIPHTLNRTTLRWRQVNDVVNLENDLLGKYIYKFLHSEEEKGSALPIDRTFLKKHGFA
jgi:riboflavin synthase